MISLVTLAIAAAIAGHPVDVRCDADKNPPPGLTPAPGYVIEGWAYVGGNEIHMLPHLCADTNAPVGSLAFAQALRVVIHEAAHARGVAVEACAELWAALVVFDILRRFYGIPFFSKLSESIGRQVLAETRLRPPNYQPRAESCERGAT